MLLAIGIALGSALGLAGGFVIQQHAAAEEPPDERLSIRLLLHLVRRPIWLGGIGVMVIGQILGAVALGEGSIALVEPVMAMNLLFALPLSALWYRQRLGVREWAGAIALIGGLVAFIAAGDPHGGNPLQLAWPKWVLSTTTIVAVALILVAVARRYTSDMQATLLATSAGVLYGLQDALTQRTIDGFSHGIGSLLVTWPAYALVAVAVVALLIGQSSFEAASLAASLPAITVAEPVTGIAFGVGAYGAHLRLGAVPLAFEILGFGAMIAGVILVARSPLVTRGGQPTLQPVPGPPVDDRATTASVVPARSGEQRRPG